MNTYLPDWIYDKKAIINPKSDDKDSFKWAVVASLLPEPKHTERISKRQKEKALEFGFLPPSFPIEEQVEFFEKNNDVSVSVLTDGPGKSFIPWRTTSLFGVKKYHVTLFLHNERFFPLRNLSRLLGPGAGKRKKEFCEACFGEIKARQAHVHQITEPLVDEKKLKEVEKQFKKMNLEKAEEAAKRKREIEQGKSHGAQERMERDKTKKELMELLPEFGVDEERIKEIIKEHDSQVIMGMKKRKQVENLAEYAEVTQQLLREEKEDEEKIKKILQPIADEIKSIEASAMKRKSKKSEFEKKIEKEEKDKEKWKKELQEFFPQDDRRDAEFVRRFKRMPDHRKRQTVERFIKVFENATGENTRLSFLLERFPTSVRELEEWGFNVNVMGDTI